MKIQYRIFFSTLILFFVSILGYVFIDNIDIHIISKLSILDINTYCKILIGFVMSMLIIIMYNNILLKENGFSVNLLKMMMIFWVSQTSNYLTFSKVGIPVRVYLLKKLLGVPYSISISIKVVVTILMLFTISTVGIFSGYYAPNIPYFIKSNVIYGSILLMFLLSITVYLGKRILIIKSGKILLITRILEYTKNIYYAMNQISLRAIMLTFLGILFRSLISAFVTLEIINSISLISPSLLDIWLIQAINAIVSIVSFVPMGLGTKDLSLIYFLSVVGLNTEESILLAIYERLIWMIFPFILGFISSIVLGISVFKKD